MVERRDLAGQTDRPLYVRGLEQTDGRGDRLLRSPPPAPRPLRTLHPNGLLPIIHSDIYDASGAVGLRGVASGWNWDLGTVYGQNQFGFLIKNTANVSLGPTSPTQFDAGKLRFGQSTTTLDLNRDFKDVPPSPVNIAACAEF